MTVEPLDPQTWFAQLGRLRKDHARAEDGSLPRLLRRAFYLTELCPVPLRGHVATALEEDSFLRHVEEAAYETAALALVSQRMGITLARAIDDGRFTVAIGLQGASEPGRCRNENLAFAIVGAWVHALDLLQVDALPDAFEITRPDQRSSRSVPRRQ